MSFRNINSKDQFCEKASLGFKEFYEQFQKNKNLEDFWKRNLGYLVNCRSIKDIEQHTKIDPPVKLFMQRDIDGLYGRYIAVVESKEDDSFILGDCYPLVFLGDPNRIPLYDICPISPKRAIIIASKEVDNVPCNVLALRKGVFDLPEINENNNYVIITKRLHSDEVEFVNTEITKNSHKGFIFFKSDNTK